MARLFGTRFAAALAMVVLLAAGQARAAVNLVVNGDFESTLVAGSYEFGGRYPSQQVTGWSTNGYNFLFTPGSADTAGATGEYGNLQLWGPNNGSANGLTAASPTGGNFIAADGAFGTDAITQTVTGLSVGGVYQLTFYWGAAQQKGFSGSTTENWTVGFGGQTYVTSTITTPDKGFQPWRQETVLFKATSTSQVLSFLAAGTPSGQPPFSLLDGVVLTAAPEPTTWAILSMALVGALVVFRRRRSAPPASPST